MSLPASQTDSLTDSFFYQYRSIVTTLSLLAGWMLVFVSAPFVQFSRTQTNLIQFLGFILFSAGVLLRLWATASIGGRKQLTIVRDGPYRFCRNPLYWGTFLIASSMAAFLQSAVFELLLLVPVLFYVLGVVPAEERAMLNKFGEDYVSFCRTTPRWWPTRFDPLKSGKLVVDRELWWKEYCRCQCWCLLMVLSVALSDARSADWWPRLALLP